MLGFSRSKGTSFEALPLNDDFDGEMHAQYDDREAYEPEPDAATALGRDEDVELLEDAAATERNLYPVANSFDAPGPHLAAAAEAGFETVDLIAMPAPASGVAEDVSTVGDLPNDAFEPGLPMCTPIVATEGHWDVQLQVASGLGKYHAAMAKAKETSMLPPPSNFGRIGTEGTTRQPRRPVYETDLE